MSFGTNLSKLRKQHNLSQEELAERLGVSRQTISKWETDDNFPEMDKLIFISKIFDCDLDSLMKDEIVAAELEEKSVKNNSVMAVKLPTNFKEIYLRFVRKSAIGFAISSVLILGAAELPFIISGMILNHNDVWPTPTLVNNLWLPLVSIVLAGIAGIVGSYFMKKAKEFRKKYTVLPQNLIPETESKKLQFRMRILTAINVLSGLACMIVFAMMLGTKGELMTIFSVLLIITIVADVYNKVLKHYLNIEKYNYYNQPVIRRKVTKINNVIMFVLALFSVVGIIMMAIATELGNSTWSLIGLAIIVVGFIIAGAVEGFLKPHYGE